MLNSKKEAMGAGEAARSVKKEAGSGWKTKCRSFD